MNRYAIGGFLAAVILSQLHGQTLLAPRENRQTEIETEVKNLLDKYAGSDDSGPPENAAKQSLIALGPPALPSLEKIFRETKDNYYRSSVISTILAIEGGSKTASRIAEEEIRIDPRQGDGGAWILTSIIILERSEPAIAVRLAIQALEESAGSTDLVSLWVVGKHGQPEHLASLERYLAKRRRAQPQGSAPDGNAISAQEAIDAIQQRAGGHLRAGSPSNTDQDGLTNPAASGTDVAAKGISHAPPGVKPAEGVGLRSRSWWRTWWVWAGIGLGVVFALLYFFVRAK